jgi:hypothetical protein
MARGHRKQHYVAQSYLLAWADPNVPSHHDPYVWSFPAEGGDAKKKAPKKIFHEIDMYTRPVGPDGRDVTIEQGLNKLEGAFAQVRRHKLDQRKALETDDELAILAFAAAQYFRTPAMREHIRGQWSPVISSMERMKASFERMTPEQRRVATSISSPGEGPSMTEEDVRQLVAFPLQHSLMSNIRTVLPHLTQFDLAFLCTSEADPFITSDNPCVWFDPAGHKRPPLHRGPALMYPTLEITMPLSPTCLLLLNKKGVSGYFEIPAIHVGELNRRTRAHAENYFVSRTNDSDPFWYIRGEPPQDNEIGPSILY